MKTGGLSPMNATVSSAIWGQTPDRWALGRVAVLCGTTATSLNAIMEYSCQLDRALKDVGVDSTLLAMSTALPDLRNFQLVILQYNPFLYGRWGFAPQLIAGWAQLRAMSRRPRLALMVHETYFPISDWRSAIMGSWQRLQLHTLHALSDVLFASIEPWAQLISQWRPHRPTSHLPVGSNLPDKSACRGGAREAIGAGLTTMVVVSFGSSHPSRRIDYTVAATNRIANSYHDVVLLNLGADAPQPTGVDPNVKVIQPGALSAEGVARLLSAGDLFLAPFTDGLSSRRTSVMAALQHGLPVVATRGQLTDRVFDDDSGVVLVPANDHSAFVHAAASLATDAGRRGALGIEAATFYHREFDWSRIAARLCERLGRISEPTQTHSCTVQPPPGREETDLTAPPSRMVCRPR